MRVFFLITTLCVPFSFTFFGNKKASSKIRYEFKKKNNLFKLFLGLRKKKVCYYINIRELALKMHLFFNIKKKGSQVDCGS